MVTSVSNLEFLYLKLPILMQNIICSLEGWRIQRSRFSNFFHSLLREAESRTFWSKEQIQAYRDERLRKFIQHCAVSVPFYRKIFRAQDIYPDEIRSIEDLKYLPILNKDMVKENYSELTSEAIPKDQQIITHTSGTTGGGLRFATTLRAIQEQWAIWWRYRHWHGIKQGIWCGYFGGRSVVPLSQTKPPFWRYNYFGKQILFSAYHMNPSNLEYYVKELCEKRPPWLHGYPSLLTLMANYILEKGIELPYKIRWITIGAENLLHHQSLIIEKAFGVRPIQHYGMAEAVANISECPLGKLHVDEDFAAVEFIPSHDGAGYKVVGTNFTNLATPLIRYDVQDVVTLSDEKCSCGRPGRIVQNIDGRVEDYIILRNGSKLGRMDHIFKDLVNIKEAQIYQKQPGEIVLRIVRGIKYGPKDEAMLLKETIKRVGDDTKIKIDYVDYIERTKNGKLRFVVSDIKEGQLTKSSL